MMRKLQSFRCRACGYDGAEYADVHIGEFIQQPCPLCQSGPLQRIVSFSFHRAMPEHYNHAVGSFVNNQREFRDGLKRKSEEATVRTGMEHNFQPVDLRDKEGLGVTDEGLDSTYRRMSKEGTLESTKKIITP